MTIGIAGLGLIGGSLAKAYKNSQPAGHTVYGFDIDSAILSFAQLSGAADGVLDENTIGKCDAIFIAVNPGDAVRYLEQNAKFIAKDALVIDCCGVKQSVCLKCQPLAEKFGFVFIGGHPMAGSHKAGFKNSRADLFHGAYMILVPPVYDDPVLFGRLEDVLKPIGFGHITITTAEKHDEMIAFSSQMAHVVSNAFIKSPSAGGHKGFSAGSYRDLTRVAQLNADMWGELLMDNSGYLINELDIFTDSIKEYRNALETKDLNKLVCLLEDGSRRKGELDSE
ncbi:MAG: prephenate dehydrogenase [Oscillospiraceae bacterium]|nr:prephenate dehydrogenase [Oscillospiraceae bacterium]